MVWRKSSSGASGKKTIGFGADIRKREEKQIGEILRQIMPEDLLKYGLIPEFVGRVPIVCTLDALDEDGLVAILTEPRMRWSSKFPGPLAHGRHRAGISGRRPAPHCPEGFWTRRPERGDCARSWKAS